MNIQQKIASRTEKLQAILAGANNSLKRKNGTEAADLSGIPAAIDALPSEYPDLQVKSVDPTGEVIMVEPDEGYDGLSAVIVGGDAFLIPENIAKGITIYGVTGTLDEGESIIWRDDFEIMPEAYDFTLNVPEGYGIRKIVVLGDEDLVPENIKKGVNLFNTEGTYEGNAIPEPYASYIAEAEAVYTGDYANVIYAEGYGADTGVTYHTVMFLLDNWAISAYDAATTGYTHSGFMMVQKEDEGEWALTDYSSTSTDTHYAKNIKAASCYITYNDMTLFPVGLGSYPDTTAINYANWDSGSFTETLETGDVLTYTVAFDDAGQPTTITAPDGTVTAIDWGES